MLFHMVSLREIKEKGYIPQRTYLKLMLGGAFTMGKVLLTNLRALKKLRQISPNEERYVRPPRRYKLPKYEEGMKHCNSNEKRPDHLVKVTVWIEICSNHGIHENHGIDYLAQRHSNHYKSQRGKFLFSQRFLSKFHKLKTIAEKHQVDWGGGMFRRHGLFFCCKFQF